MTLWRKKKKRKNDIFSKTKYRRWYFQKIKKIKKIVTWNRSSCSGNRFGNSSDYVVTRKIRKKLYDFFFFSNVLYIWTAYIYIYILYMRIRVRDRVGTSLVFWFITEFFKFIFRNNALFIRRCTYIYIYITTY